MQFLVDEELVLWYTTRWCTSHTSVDARAGAKCSRSHG